MPVSLAALNTGAVGATGNTVSTVTEELAVLTDRFPATSAAFAVIVWVPLVNALEVTEYAVEVAVMLPTATEPSKRNMGVPAVVEPENVGVGSFVILSVVLRPVSLAAVSTGAPGAAGAVTSMVTIVPDEMGPALSAMSVAFAVIVFVLSGRALDVILYAPDVACPVPIAVVPS
jgi:hypothetical protein